MYSKKTIEFVLNYYWDLRGGKIPHDINSFHTNNNKSIVETISIWLADIDQGIDRLDERHPGKWLSVTQYLTPARLSKIVTKFSRRQQAILCYYLLGQDEWQGIDRKYAQVVIYILRKRLKSKLSILIDNVLDSLVFETII